MPEIDEKLFRKHLEWLVDLLPGESAPYFEERPRFVHAVLVLADDAREGEVIKASCIKQLDPEIIERRTKITQITETDDQPLTKNNGLIDSGIHEIQESSGDENDKLEPAEIIRPTQQLAFVPLSKYVRPTQTEAQKSSGVGAESNKANYYTQSYLVDNKLGHEREGNVYVNKEGAHRLQTGTSRSDAKDFQNASNGQRIKTEEYSYKIPQMTGTTYERPEIISRTYRSHVEETTFPSIDRYRTVRSETVRIEPRSSPRSLLNSTPLESKTTRTETYTVTSVPQKQTDDDVIAQAVQILQSSCDMLDETADRIHRRKILGQNSNFSFPSESRKKTTA